MEVYLASAAGLLSWCGKWRKIPTPLAHPTLLAACGADVALADSVNRLLYRQGRISTLPPGVEVLRCWRNQLLTLSSETNCLHCMMHTITRWLHRPLEFAHATARSSTAK